MVQPPCKKFHNYHDNTIANGCSMSSRIHTEKGKEQN